MKSSAYPCLFLIILLVSGCGGADGPPRADVIGKVLLDGEPIQEGWIIFTPQDGIQGPQTQFDIKDGTYQTNSGEPGVVVGRNSVMISSGKPTGRKVKNLTTGVMQEESVEAVAKKYSEEQTLFVTVEKGKNTFDFEVEGRGKK